jgi:hypothetical protein
MLDSLTRNNAGDFLRRYQNTFGYYPLKDRAEKLLVKIDKVTDTTVNFRDKDGYKYSAVADNNVQFEFIQVNKGWYNQANSKPVFFSRVPARQWQRGISPQNTVCYTFADSGVLTKSHVDYDTVECIQNAYKPFIDAYFRGEISSVALNKFFAIGPEKNLYMFDLLAGEIVEDKIKVKLPLFRQEIIDCVRRLNLNLIVE